MIYSYAPKIPERPSAEGFYCPARARAPAREAQRDFPVPRAKFRLRSTCSAKNRLGVCKTPILLRKTALLAAYPYPSLKIPERPSAEGFYCPARARAPARVMPRGQKSCHLRVTAFFYVCRRWSLENTPPAIAQEEGRIQVFSGKERYYPSGNSRWGWTAM